MGFLERSLRKSEERLFTGVLGQVAQLGVRDGIFLDEINCSEQAGFTHLGLRVQKPGSSSSFFHRCRNRWFVSTNRVGLNYLPLASWSSVELPDIAASLAMHLIAESSEVVEIEQTETLEPDEAGPRSLLETELGRQTLSEYLPRLTSAGIGEDAALQLIGPTISSMLYEWAVHLGGKQEEEEVGLGSKWLNQSKPQTQYGEAVIARIHSRSASLYEMGIQPLQIAEYWNQTFFQRYSVYAISVVSALRTAEALRKKCEEIAPDDVTACSEGFAKALVVTCQKDSEEISLDPFSALPPEAYGAALELHMEFKNRMGMEDYLDFASSTNANNVARSLLRESRN